MESKISSKQIDLLNIGLILLSLIIAIYLPFKLFLFSYAVLGPLHYLTEINWLNDKNFFIKNPNKWAIPLIISSLILGIYGMLKVSKWNFPTSWEGFIRLIEFNYSTIIFTCFLFSISLVFLKKWKHLIISLFISFFISYVLNWGISEWFIMIGIFVPTIIHVYLFTGLFMWWGAKKGKSRTGFLACIVLFVVPVIIYYLPVNEAKYLIDEEVLKNFISSNMAGVNQKMAQLFVLKPNEKFVLLSELGIRIQIFIAFAYTYHYLNWFSKTSIIGWQQSLTHKKTYLIIIIWMTSVFLYYYNFNLGFVALFFLSFLHVFLEFPLNVITIRDLFKHK